MNTHTHTILTAEEIISRHEKYGTNAGGITEDLWSSFSKKFTEAELMKNTVNLSALGWTSNPESDGKNEILCEIFRGWRAALVCLSSFSPCVCLLSHFQPDVSLSSLCPPSNSFCLFYLCGAAGSNSASIWQQILKERERERWGQKVGKVKMAEIISCVWLFPQDFCTIGTSWK